MQKGGFWQVLWEEKFIWKFRKVIPDHHASKKKKKRRLKSDTGKTALPSLTDPVCLWQPYNFVFFYYYF